MKTNKIPLWQRKDLLAAVFLVLLFSALYLPRLGSYAFWDPWEPHYSQVALEMHEHGTWMEPWYRGQNRWWSKPILPLWLLRGSFALFGVEDPADPWLHFAGRLPIVLVALLGLVLTYLWVSRLTNRRTGMYAALVLGTCPMYLLLAHQVMFDLPFIVFVSTGLGYYFVARSEAGRPRHLYFFYALLGLAFLCKWLLAFFIPAGIWISECVLRWDKGVFKRIGLGNLMGGLGATMAVGGLFLLWLPDKAFAGMLTVVVLSLVLVWWMGQDAAGERGWQRRHAWFSFALGLAIILPWHLFMIIKHGWPFVREAVIYHHFERAAGTIGKPEGTFDVFFKQIAFGTYPWIALLPAALWGLLGKTREELAGGGERRELRLVLAVLVPWTAFSLFQTKFHHYIAPVVPFLAVLIAVGLDRLGDQPNRGKMRLCAMLAVPVAAVMMLDILHDYSPFVHLFDYYYGWPLPRELNPYPLFTVLGGIWLGLMLWLFFRWKIGPGTVGLLWLPAAALGVTLTAWIMPAVTPTFTQYPLYQAYLKESGGRAPVAQYNGWLSRSVSFYFRNQAVDLSRGDQPNLERALEFLARPARSFLILGAGYGRDCKSLLASLRPEVRKRLGKSLYVVFDDHPFSCLASTQRDPEGEKRLQENLLQSLPAGVHRASVDFDGKIELLGWQVEPQEVEQGQEFVVSYYFRCRAPVGDDWLVFIHGDGPQGGAHRIFGDHAPLGGLYPTSEWQPGQLIRDSYRMVVPANYPYRNFTLWMGFWKGPRRLPVSQKFMHDGANRVRTAVVRVK